MPGYTVLQAQRNQQPVIIVVNNELAHERERPRFPYLISIELAMRSPDPKTGLCDQPESARLDGIEDEVLSALDTDEYRLIGHITGNGAREVLIYSRDSISVPDELRLALIKSGKQQRPSPFKETQTGITITSSPIKQTAILNPPNSATL